jgi:hypothetical protein
MTQNMTNIITNLELGSGTKKEQQVEITFQRSILGVETGNILLITFTLPVL